jgi:polygalacturonase
MEGITVYNCKTWDIVPVLCNNVKINNIKIVSDNGSDDGIDIVSTKNVIVSNSFIHTKDDCIAVKSHGFPLSRTEKSPQYQQAFGQLTRPL